MTMTMRQEDVGRNLLTLILGEAQHFSWSDLLILRSASQGKVAWSEMPDHLRGAFFRVAIESSRFVNNASAIR